MRKVGSKVQNATLLAESGGNYFLAKPLK